MLPLRYLDSYEWYDTQPLVRDVDLRISTLGSFCTWKREILITTNQPQTVSA